MGREGAFETSLLPQANRICSRSGHNGFADAVAGSKKIKKQHRRRDPPLASHTLPIHIHIHFTLLFFTWLLVPERPMPTRTLVASSSLCRNLVVPKDKSKRMKLMRKQQSSPKETMLRRNDVPSLHTLRSWRNRWRKKTQLCTCMR